MTMEKVVISKEAFEEEDAVVENKEIKELPRGEVN